MNIVTRGLGGLNLVTSGLGPRIAGIVILLSAGEHQAVHCLTGSEHPALVQIADTEERDVLFFGVELESEVMLTGVHEEELREVLLGAEEEDVIEAMVGAEELPITVVLASEEDEE